MFSIFKKNKTKLEIPKWASFFKDDEYEVFLKAIENYFYSINVTYVLGDGSINAAPNDFGFETLGLVNVAQVCKQDEKKNYSKIIKDHFDTFLRTSQFDKEFKKIIHDFDQVKEYIAVRLYPDDYLPETAKNVALQKNFVGDIIALLVFDLPDSITSITSEVADKWGKTLDELFEIGIQNVRKKYPYNISKEQLGEISIWFVQGDHFFTPNIVFDFEAQQKLMGSKGSLVGIPHRHAVLIYPIETIEVVEAINTLIPIVKGMSDEGPGTISSNIFWYKDGLFELLRYELADGKIQFYPPENFLNMLNSLGLTE